MEFSLLIFVTLAVCINTAVGHHLREHVYEKLCDKKTDFKDGLVKCLSEMPAKDQMILKLCGTAYENEPAEDFNVLIEEMCKNVTYASKVAHCVDHISHMFYHFNESSNRQSNNDDDHNHDHDHKDHQFDFGHGVYNEECFQRLYENFNITTSEDDD